MKRIDWGHVVVGLAIVLAIGFATVTGALWFMAGFGLGKEIADAQAEGGYAPHPFLRVDIRWRRNNTWDLLSYYGGALVGALPHLLAGWIG